MPLLAYQDNGRAFKNKFFRGDFEESGLSGLFVNLGIVPMYAKPYNARAKVIERFFKEFQEGFEKLLPSYVGSNIQNKPAYTKRNEKFHKKYHKEYIPTIDELKKMVEYWMEFHNPQPCPNVKNKSIGEVFNEGRGDGFDIAVLDDLMLAQEVKTIRQNGVRFLNADYYNEELYGLKGKVIVKYSLFDLSHIKIFNLQGKFLCNAERVMPVHPAANYLGEVKDVEELKQKLKQQNRLENKTIKEVKDYLRGENLSLAD